MVGVFIGTLVSDLLTTFWYQPYVLYKKGFNVPVRKYFIEFIKYTVIVLLGIIISLIIINCINISNLIVRLIIQAIISIAVFLIIIIAIYKKNEGFIFIKNIIKSYIMNIRQSINNVNRRIIK